MENVIQKSKLDSIFMVEIVRPGPRGKGATRDFINVGADRIKNVDDPIPALQRMVKKTVPNAIAWRVQRVDKQVNTSVSRGRAKRVTTEIIADVKDFNEEDFKVIRDFERNQ